MADTTDNRGMEIVPGCRVAYNLSGQIAVGVVMDVVKTIRYGYSAYWFKIQPEYPVSARRQKESRVKDAKSILVLEDAAESGDVVSDLLNTSPTA